MDLEGPLFGWDVDEEQTVKALPRVIAWFERAGKAVDDKESKNYHIENRKLSAIFQFAKAILWFVPSSHGKRNDKKRKKDEV